MASLDLVGKMVDNRVCIPLVTAAVGVEAVGVYAESIKNE